MTTTIIRHTMNPSTTTMKGRGEYNTEKEKIQMGKLKLPKVQKVKLEKDMLLFQFVFA